MFCFLQSLFRRTVLGAVAMLSLAPLSAVNLPSEAAPPPGSPRSEFKDEIGFGKDPFYPKSSRRPKEIIKVEPESTRSAVPDSIVLKGISVVQGKKLAIINNYTMGEGEEFSFKAIPQPIRVKCVEIKDKSVVISVGNATKELLLRAF